MAAVNLERRETHKLTFKVSRKDLEELDWYIASVAGIGV